MGNEPYRFSVAPGVMTDNVDPGLLATVREASRYLPDGYTAKLTSGYRPGDPRFHGAGKAVDVQLYDDKGNPVPNYQSASNFRTYEQFAQTVHQLAPKFAADSPPIRWGGYFPGKNGKDPFTGKDLVYGATDLMHFDTGLDGQMGGGTWEDGLTPQQRKFIPGAVSVGLNDGAPNPVPTDATAFDATKPITSPALKAITATNAPTQTPDDPTVDFPGASAMKKSTADEADFMKDFPGASAMKTAAPAAASAPAQTAEAPDGVDDSFLKDFPAASAIAANTPKGPEEPISANNIVRAASTGVPIIGGLLNKADAATNATIAPIFNRFFSPSDQLQGNNWSERYNNSLAQQNAADQGFSEQHPVASTGANIAGSIAGTIPAMTAAPAAFGVSAGAGLGANMLTGAAGGAAINALDSVTRNEPTLGNALSGAETGAAFGALGPAAGKLIGAGVEGASNLLARTSPGAKNVAEILSNQVGKTPQEAAAAVSKLGPYGTLADIDPALTTEASGLASMGGTPTSILKNAFLARGAAADDRLGQIVNSSLGPAPDAVQILNEMRNRAVSSQVGPETVRAALDSSMGPAADPHDVLQSMLAQRSAAAEPLYKKAMQGGSIAPLETQLEQSLQEATGAKGQIAAQMARIERTNPGALAARGAAGADVRANYMELNSQLQKAEADRVATMNMYKKAQSDASSNAPGAVWNPRIQQFLDDPIVQPAIAKGMQIQRLESLAKGEPFNPTEYAITGTDEQGNPIVGGVPNMRTLNVVKKGLDSMVREAQDPITGRLSEQGKAFDGVRRSFLSELDKANPDYAAARQAWAGPSETQDAFNRGLNVFRNQAGSSGVNTTPGALQAFMKTASDGEKEAVKLGARSAFSQQMSTASDPTAKAAAIANKDANLQKLSAILGPDEANGLAKQLSFKYEDPVGSAFEKGLGVFQNRGGLQGVDDSPAALKSWMKTASPEEVQAHQNGARQAIEQALNAARQGDLSQARSLFAKSTANRQKLEAIFPNAGKMLDGLDSELAMRQNGNAIVSGAQTAERRAVQEKYSTPAKPGMSAVVPMLGEAIYGGPGAIATTAATMGGRAIKNAFTSAAKERLVGETAKGLSATGPELDNFLARVSRAQNAAPVTNAISHYGNMGSNLLARAAGQRAQKSAPANMLLGR